MASPLQVLPMELEVITVGNELLLGYTQDSNATAISRTLANIGLAVTRRTTVADRAEDIADAVQAALGRVKLVIVTGGLGPTADDITKKAVADLLGRELEVDADYLDVLERRFASFGRGPMPRSNLSQAEVPRGAEVIPNRQGSAPGLWLTDEEANVVLLPGVPHEMAGILAEELVPRFRERFKGLESVVTRTRTLRTTGIGESALADRMAGVEGEIGALTLAYLPTRFGVDLRLTAWSMDGAQADIALDAATATIRDKAGKYHYGYEDDDLAAVVIDGLRTIGATLAVAESCTGGLVGGRITAIAGSSDVFLGGVIAYEDDVKESLLGVDPGDLAAHGAVSSEVAEQMARGAADLFGSDFAIAVTGIAGPGGGTTEKPVGTVFVSVYSADGSDTTGRLFPGERDWVRTRSAQEALNRVRLLLEG